jgi:hypothetical protein
MLNRIERMSEAFLPTTPKQNFGKQLVKVGKRNNE